MEKKSLKVGFDLDGVLLYNPARIVRPMIAFAKKHILGRDIHRFYYPKNKLEQFIWNLLHKSSVWPAPGIDQLFNLAKKRGVKIYIVSARYESLKTDFKKWIKIIDPNHVFSGYYYNDKNEQPHIYKKAMIEKLGLDIFVEDNWDIVEHLSSELKTPYSAKVKVFWIYNLLDRNIDYRYKFPSLKSVLKFISH